MRIAGPRAAGIGIELGRGLGRGHLGADVAGQVIRERERQQPLDRRPCQPGLLERRDRAGAIHQAKAQASQPLPGGGVGGRAAGGALGGLGREVDRAHVLVDPRREPLRSRAVGLDPRPVAHRPRGRRQVPGLPERAGEQPEHDRVRGVGVPGIDEALGGQRRVALGQRVLSGGHEPLHPVGGGVGRREVDELERAGRDGPDADGELHPGPLLDVVPVAREVDAGHAPHAPFRIGRAARVAVDDRVVGDPRAERIVLLALLGRGRCALLGLVRAPAFLLAGLARRGRRDLDGVAADPPTARLLGELLELVGRLVDRLQVALMLVLAPGRRDVRMPALCHPSARELDGALIERRLDLQQEHRLLNVEDPRHYTFTLATPPT